MATASHPFTLRKLLPGAALGALLGCLLIAVVGPLWGFDMQLAEQPSDAQLAAYNAAWMSFQTQKTSTIMALVAGLFAASIAGFCRLPAKALGVAVACGLAGGALGGALSVQLLGYFTQFRDTDPVLLGISFDSLMQAMLLGACQYLPLGLGLGLGLGFAAWRFGLPFANLVLGGLLGGLLVALLYTPAVSLLSPNSTTLRPLPDDIFTLVTWGALSALSFAFCIDAATGRKAGPKDVSAESQLAAPKI